MRKLIIASLLSLAFGFANAGNDSNNGGNNDNIAVSGQNNIVGSTVNYNTGATNTGSVTKTEVNSTSKAISGAISGSNSTAIGGAGGSANSSAIGGAGGNATGGNATGGNANATTGNSSAYSGGSKATGGNVKSNIVVSVGCTDNCGSSSSTEKEIADSRNATERGIADSRNATDRGVAEDRNATDKEIAQGNNKALVDAANAKIRNTPSMFGPALVSSNDTCMGSTSGSVAAPGLGIGFGTAWVDENCKMLKNSQALWNMGLKAAAIALMCNDEKINEALEITGFKCPAKPQKVYTDSITKPYEQ
jgi:hypothetical protein